MAEYKVTLSIGYPTAKHEDVIDVDDDEIAACKSEDELDELLHQYWTEWAWNYIEGNIEPEGE